MKKICLLTLVCIMLFAAGCAKAPAAIVPSSAPDLFTIPETTTEPGERIIPGITSFGVRSDQEPDALGHYFLYEGGEMHMHIALSAQALETHGVGVLIFLDGIPQPYWMPDNNSCQYMHTFYPKDMKGKDIYEVIFTPVTGQTGDTLEIGLQCITAPEYFIGDDYIPFVQSGGSGQMVTRLKFASDPGEAILPHDPQRVLSVSQEYIDMTHDELDYWSGTDAMEKVKWTFYVDGIKNCTTRTGYTGEPMDIKLEIMGNPNAEFALAVFVNHEPVCITDDFQIDLRQGQKTILTASMDMSDFKNKAVIYAVLVPRNVRIDSLMDPSCYISASETSYYSS